MNFGSQWDCVIYAEIWLRKEEPTQILSEKKKTSLKNNEPKSLRKMNEKLYSNYYT